MEHELEQEQVTIWRTPGESPGWIPGTYPPLGARRPPGAREQVRPLPGGIRESPGALPIAKASEPASLHCHISIALGAQTACAH